MPVRSTSSPVLRWPDAETVLAAARAWADEQAERKRGLVRLGVFGSYARGDAGVGSDLDLVAVVTRTDRPRHRRLVDWPYEELPVPTELVVYEAREWDELMAQEGRWPETLRREVVWLFDRSEGVDATQPRGD